MDSTYKAFILAILAISITGCQTRQEKIDHVISLTKEHFRDTATVKDDDLEVVATIHTKYGFIEKHGLLGIQWDDNFLRAFVDKNTGNTTYQAYNIVYYKNKWRFYKWVNYETPDGPVAEDLTRIDSDVDCTGSRYGGCLFNEHVTFKVPESLLRTIAGKYEATRGMQVGWKYRLKPQVGPNYNNAFLAAEVAGLLEAVDLYKERKGLNATQSNN